MLECRQFQIILNTNTLGTHMADLLCAGKYARTYLMFGLPFRTVEAYCVHTLLRSGGLIIYLTSGLIWSESK